MISRDDVTKTVLLKVNETIYAVQVKDKFDQLLEQMGLKSGVQHKMKDMKAPMPGLVIEVRVEAGQHVKQGDAVIVRKVQQVQSIKGIGQVTAVALLAYTKGFTSFSNAKELACYCGVVPFAKRSGTSIRFKPAVSPYANKKLKKLLHLCALSAIKNDIEIQTYFERKVAEGKNKMSVINAVRNKLVHRVFAVIRDDRYYEENYIRKCA